jgi:hypothetical protein
VSVRACALLLAASCGARGGEGAHPDRAVENSAPIDAAPAGTAAAEWQTVRTTRLGALEVERELNASGRANVDIAGTPWLFVSVSGQLFLTDGRDAESLALDWDAGNDAHTDLVLLMPLDWATVGDGARVVEHSADHELPPVPGA